MAQDYTILIWRIITELVVATGQVNAQTLLDLDVARPAVHVRHGQRGAAVRAEVEVVDDSCHLDNIHSLEKKY